MLPQTKSVLTSGRHLVHTANRQLSANSIRREQIP
jgi:hypothetical protein